MAGQRKALIIANDTYEQEALGDLQAPAADAEALGRVLGDPQIGDFAVQVVHNEPAHVIQAQIEEIFSESRPDDVLLLHFSGHGLKSESGELFFAAANTRPNRLGSTAVSADFVQRCMRASRSRSVVLLLDCCYGGAFAQGVRVRAGGDVNVLDSFPQGRTGGGRGRAVITASGAMEFAFEGDRLGDDQRRLPSVFTTALVEGLETGEADLDEDGWVSLDELYDYLFDKVREQNPHQTPSRQFEMEGELYLARSRRRRIRPGPIPADLQRAIADPNAYTRLGGVGELRTRLASDDLPAAAGACEALAELARTDVRLVAEAAAAALSEAAVRPDQTELHFGRVEQGASPPRQRVQLLGPLIARTCEPVPSHDWIHVDQTAAGLDISIDTTATGTQHGSVGLKGLAGEATIAIDVDLVPARPQPSPIHTQDGPAGRPVLDSAIPTSAPETPAAMQPPRQPGQVTQPLAEEQAGREPERSSTVTIPSLDPEPQLAPLAGLAGSGGPDDQVTASSQPDDWPGGSGPDTPRPKRKRTRRRSLVLLSAVLAGLAVVAVASAALLTRTPPAKPAISPVSYSFAPQKYRDGLLAVRHWTLGGRNGSLFTETITVSSSYGKALLVRFKEPIPTAIAANLRTVRFTPAPFKIISADPLVEWKMRMPAHGTVTVGYHATVAPAGVTMARLTRWVTDFKHLAVTVNPSPVQRSGSGKGSGSGSWVAVPDVSGQTSSQATATLQNDGLTVNPATTSSCAASSGGLVVGQNPAAGTSVHPGTTVAIDVCSTNQSTVVVPSLIGQTQGQAEATLQNDGLVAAVTVIPDCYAGGPGLVISQTPGGGASVQVGATVGIDVGGQCTPTPSPT